MPCGVRAVLEALSQHFGTGSQSLAPKWSPGLAWVLAGDQRGTHLLRQVQKLLGLTALAGLAYWWQDGL